MWNTFKAKVVRNQQQTLRITASKVEVERHQEQTLRITDEELSRRLNMCVSVIGSAPDVRGSKWKDEEYASTPADREMGQGRPCIIRCWTRLPWIGLVRKRLKAGPCIVV